MPRCSMTMRASPLPTAEQQSYEQASEKFLRAGVLVLDDNRSANARFVD